MSITKIVYGFVIIQAFITSVLILTLLRDPQLQYLWQPKVLTSIPFTLLHRFQKLTPPGVHVKILVSGEGDTRYPPSGVWELQ
jgi:hypothetical protein